MELHTTEEARTRAVNLRMRVDTCALIDRVAKARGKSRSSFVIDAARQAAEDALLDQTFISVDEKTYKLFLKVLDKPPGGKGYKRLMKARKPWKT